MDNPKFNNIIINNNNNNNNNNNSILSLHLQYAILQKTRQTVPIERGGRGGGTEETGNRRIHRGKKERGER